MAAEQYIYQAMSVHLREKEMLAKQDFERLASAKDADEACAILIVKGWDIPGLASADADGVIAAQRDRVWELVNGLVGDISPFRVLLYANDYHNLKAAVKLAYSRDVKGDASRYFLKSGTVKTDDIAQAAQSHNFSLLPPDMGAAGQAAYEMLAHTGNGQYCDMLIDNAALMAIDRAGKEAKSALLREYAVFTVDCANIKAAARCISMGKKRDFAERAIAAAGSLSAGDLINAVEQGADALYGYLLQTAYSDAVEPLRKGLVSFERWCDNRLIDMIRPSRYDFFTEEPIAAYVIAREIELRMVKIILSAKINDMDESVILERLRESYV